MKLAIDLRDRYRAFLKFCNGIVGARPLLFIGFVLLATLAALTEGLGVGLLVPFLNGASVGTGFEPLGVDQRELLELQRPGPTPLQREFEVAEIASGPEIAVDAIVFEQAVLHAPVLRRGAEAGLPGGNALRAGRELAPGRGRSRRGAAGGIRGRPIAVQLGQQGLPTRGHGTFERHAGIAAAGLEVGDEIGELLRGELATPFVV